MCLNQDMATQVLRMKRLGLSHQRQAKDQLFTSKTHNLQQTFAPMKMGLGILGDKLESSFDGALCIEFGDSTMFAFSHRCATMDQE